MSNNSLKEFIDVTCYHFGMVESSVSIHTEWSPERIRDAFPNGVFFYSALDGNPRELYSILSPALPDTLVVVDSTEYEKWYPFPQDGLVQLGSKMFLQSASLGYLHTIFRQFPELSSMEKRSLTPKFFYTKNELGFDIVGGETIRVGGSDDVWATGLSDEKIARLNAENPVYSMQLIKQMALRVKHSQASLVDNVLYFEHEEGKKDFSHEDMLATAFVRPGGGYIWYVDEPIREFALSHGSRDVRDLFETSAPLQHEYTRKGGANIWYECNARTGHWMAIVPSVEAIGPIATDLHRSGYDIVELGSEQFSPFERAGVKCKSMHMYWSEE